MRHIGAIDDKLGELHDVHHWVGEQIALLSMLAVARMTRKASPDATAVGLGWSDQGPYLVPDGSYLAADGTLVDEDAVFNEDALVAAIHPYCSNLSEDNEAAWSAFTSHGPDGQIRLKIDDVLAVLEPGSETIPAAMPSHEHGMQVGAVVTAFTALTGIRQRFRAEEIECLVRTAAEAVWGQLDDLSRCQMDLAARAYVLLAADDQPSAAATSSPRRARSSTDVWVLRHEDKHGDDISLHASRADGLGALAQTVRSRWDNITGNPGVPAVGDFLDDDAAVEMYFRHRSGIESYALYSEEVQGIHGATTPYDLSDEEAETLVLLAAVTAGEHRDRPDTGSTAYLRALSVLNQRFLDSAQIHELAIRVLQRIGAG